MCFFLHLAYGGYYSVPGGGRGGCGLFSFFPRLGEVRSPEDTRVTNESMRPIFRTLFFSLSLSLSLSRSSFPSTRKSRPRWSYAQIAQRLPGSRKGGEGRERKPAVSALVAKRKGWFLKEAGRGRLPSTIREQMASQMPSSCLRFGQLAVSPGNEGE